jgi:hypothetical protein
MNEFDRRSEPRVFLDDVVLQIVKKMGWNVQRYRSHIGIIDKNGHSVASIVGDPDNVETLYLACLIAVAVNDYVNRRVIQ